MAGPRSPQAATAGPNAPITIRHDLRPGDLGMVTHLHGVHYAREYGLDLTFEPYVACPLAEFVLAGPSAGRIWIAERTDKTVGSIAMVIDAGAQTAQLRWFLIVPKARGTGLAKTLLATAMAYAEQCGVGSVTLWTFDDLSAAIKLYRDAVFTTIDKKTSHVWGAERTELKMRKDLT